jgi:hypothetical protein
VGAAPDAPFKLVAVGPGTAVALTSISIHDGRSTIRPLKTDTVRPWPAALKSPCGRRGVEWRRYPEMVLDVVPGAQGYAAGLVVFG